MLILTGSDVLRVRLNAAHTTSPLSCVASWRDVDTDGSEQFVPGSSKAFTNGTSNVTVVPAPAANRARVVDLFRILNADTTAKTVTVELFDGSNAYELYSVTLAPDEVMHYSDAGGFQTFNSAGAEKLIMTGAAVPVASGWQSAVLAADVINNNATFNTIADVTGLSFAVAASTTYWFKFWIWYTAAATTTGSRWSINGPGSPTLIYRSEYSLTTTSRTINDSLGAYDLPAASNATSGSTGPNLAIVEGRITPSAAGTVIARFASEVASSAITAKAGSFVEWLTV
jgi:hypothetical protein